jgi:hypothetical protein
MIFPITLGQGNASSTAAPSRQPFKVTESQVTPNGIISVSYERDGDVKTGAPQISED